MPSGYLNAKGSEGVTQRRESNAKCNGKNLKSNAIGIKFFFRRRKKLMKIIYFSRKKKELEFIWVTHTSTCAHAQVIRRIAIRRWLVVVVIIRFHVHRSHMHIIAHETEYRWHGLILYWISVALGRMQIKRRKWLTHIHSQIRKQKSESRKRKIKHFASIHSFVEVEIVVADVVCTHFLFFLFGLTWLDFTIDAKPNNIFRIQSMNTSPASHRSLWKSKNKYVPGIVHYVLLTTWEETFKWPKIDGEKTDFSSPSKRRRRENKRMPNLNNKLLRENDRWRSCSSCIYIFQSMVWSISNFFYSCSGRRLLNQINSDALTNFLNNFPPKSYSTIRK